VRGDAGRGPAPAARLRDRPPHDPARGRLDRHRRAPGQGLLPRPGDGGPGAQPRPAAAPAGAAAPVRRTGRAAGPGHTAGARRAHRRLPRHRRPPPRVRPGGAGRGEAHRRGRYGPGRRGDPRGGRRARLSGAAHALGDPRAGADLPVVPDRARRLGDRAETTARLFEVPRAYGSYQQLLADPEVEAVYVGTPNSVHAHWAIAAARAGKHVLCEKPLGVSRAEAETMFEAAREHGVWLMEAFMYRFHPRTLRLAEIVAAGEIGAPTLVRASFGFPVSDPANVRLSAELAGGALMDVGCYPVNAARMVAGPVRAASATARWQDVDVTLAGVLDHAGGALSLVSCSLLSGRHN